MRSQFPLFQSTRDLAQLYWAKLAFPGAAVIDATCGNGHDALILAQSVLAAPEGKLWAIDLQAEALEATRTLLQASLPAEHFSRAIFLQSSHAQFPPEIDAASIQLIVYNLGYLPGGNKQFTTQTTTTLTSLESGCALIRPGGAISVTCYPGHPAGKEEEEAILRWARNLDAKQWSVCFHRWENRREAPSLLLMQRCRKF